MGRLLLTVLFTSAYLSAAPNPPGFSILASKKIIIPPREWKQQQPIDMWAFESHVKGIAKTEATANFFLLPHPTRIDGYFEVVGSTVSSTAATKKNVSVYSKSITKFLGRKNIAFDIQGPVFQKALTKASTTSKILGVKAGPPLAGLKRRIAYKKAKELQPQSNALTNNTAIKTVNTTLDETVAQEAIQAWGPISDVLKDPTLEALKLQDMTWSSTKDWVRIDGLKSLMVAASPFPQNLASDLQINISALSLSETLKAVAGLEFDLGEKIMHGELGEFRFTFAQTNPVSIRADKNQVYLALELDELVVDHGKFPARQISMTYQIAKTSTGLEGTRLGALNILPPQATAATPLTPEDKDLAKAMERELDFLFPDRFAITLPPFKGMTTHFDSFATLQDWLQINLSFLKTP